MKVNPSGVSGGWVLSDREGVNKDKMETTPVCAPYRGQPKSVYLMDGVILPCNTRAQRSDFTVQRPKAKELHFQWKEIIIE